MSSSPLTRRQLLRQAFYFSAATALTGRLSAQQPLSPPSGGGLHFLMLGDFGALGQRPAETLEPGVKIKPGVASAAPPAPAPYIAKQTLVANAMRDYVRVQGIAPEGLFFLGDNFYGPLKGGVNSPRWKSGFEEMYPASYFPGPCWAMLGNHDYDEENFLKLAAELSYADAHPGTRWTMPAKWYRVDWPAKDPLVTCFVLDSNYNNSLVYLSPKEIAKQNAWLKAELEKPRKTAWTFAFGHHPLYSNGPHGDTPALIKDWGPLFQKHNVAAYFCGHDHDLQHLEFEGLNTSFIVSGGGGAGLSKLKKADRSFYSESVHGFTHLEVRRDKFIVRHLDASLNRLHAFSREASGHLRILG